MRKRLLTMLLVLAMVLTFAPGLAMAAEGAASTFAEVKATLENGGAITEPVAVELSNASGVYEYVLGSATKPLGDVDISNVTFISVDDENSGEECTLVIHTTGKVTGADTCGVEVSVVTYVAKVGDTYYETLAAAVASDAKEIVVELLGDATYDVAAWQNNAMGGETTETITINGNNNTLTFNHTNSDWNNVVTKGAKLVINNAKITNSGHNNGPWNRHDINFGCEVELNDVISNKALAFKAAAKLTNVTITEDYTSDVYGIWIQANGQTVSMTNVTIDTTAATDGRGITINDEYVADTCKKITLQADGLTIKSEEKGAIIAKSAAGADITLSNVNIENTIDPVHAVWVDEDRADAEVTVTGAKRILEGTVAEVDGVQFASLAEAVEAADAGETVTLLADVEISSQLVIDKAITLDGAGNKITALPSDAANYGEYSSYMISVSADVTVKNLIIDGGEAKVMGIQFYACEGILEDVTIQNVTRYYPVHVNAANVKIAGELEVINTVDTYVPLVAIGYGKNLPEGSKSTLTMEADASIVGADVYFVAEDLANVAATKGSMTATVTEDTSVVGAVAKIGNVYYISLAEAIEAADAGETVTLLADVVAQLPSHDGYAYGSAFSIEKNLTLNGNDHKVTIDTSNWAKFNDKVTGYVFNVGVQDAYHVAGGANDIVVTIQNLTIEGNAEYMRGGINAYAMRNVTAPTTASTKLILSNVNISGCGTFSLGLNNADVTVKNCNLADGGWGHAIDADKGSPALTVESGDIGVIKFGNNADTVKQTARIKGGNIVAVVVGEGVTEDIQITGGTFYKDPTAYVAEGYVVSCTTNDADQKVYTVVKQKDAVEDPETNTAFGAGESTGGVSATVTEISGKDVLDAANSEDTSDSLVDAAQNVVTVTEDVKKEANDTAKEVFGEDAVTEQTPVVVEVRSYLEVLVDEVDMNEQTMTVEIEALYNTVAVVGNREVAFGEPKPMDTVGQAITITLPIPADFADASYIYVKHIKKDDEGNVVATYTYETTVSKVGGKFYVTFVNPHGFSEFNVITSETEMEVDKDCILGHTYDDDLDGICNVCDGHRENLENRIMKDIFRMYNPYSGEHFYTGSEVERDDLIAAGWNYEGVAFTFPTDAGAPVHRLYHKPTGEHIYTMDEAEKDRLLDEGWNYEGVAFNSAYNTEAVQYRLFNPYATVGAYHFTHSEEEKQNLIDAGWEYQGIGWYSCYG